MCSLFRGGFRGPPLCLQTSVFFIKIFFPANYKSIRPWVLVPDASKMLIWLSDFHFLPFHLFRSFGVCIGGGGRPGPAPAVCMQLAIHLVYSILGWIEISTWRRWAVLAYTSATGDPPFLRRSECSPITFNDHWEVQQLFDCLWIKYLYNVPHILCLRRLCIAMFCIWPCAVLPVSLSVFIWLQRLLKWQLPLIKAHHI